MQCDEQLPACTRCVKRGEKCSFLTTASEQDSPNSHSNSNGTPHDCTAEQHARQSLELELMHQWSTATYKSMEYNRPDSETTLAINLPRSALKYDYLLDGMFSFTALHLAHEHQADPHTMEYYVAAAMSFRDRGMQRAAPVIQEFHHIDYKPEASEVFALFWFAALTGMTSMALTVLTRREPANFASPGHVTGRAFINMQVEMAQLWRGTRSIMILASTMKTNTGVYIRDDEPEPSVAALDPETDAALSQLETFISNPAPTPSSSVSEEDHTPVYRQSVALIRKGYESFAENGSVDDALAWSPILGSGFAHSLDEGVPLALLNTLCYGTLLDRISVRWWAGDAGRMLVHECSTALAGCPEEWHPLIRWARTRVGLPEASPASSGPSDPPSVGLMIE